MFTETCNMNWFERDKPDEDTQLYVEYKVNSAKNKHSVRIGEHCTKMLLGIISDWEIEAWVDDL